MLRHNQLLKGFVITFISFLFQQVGTSQLVAPIKDTNAYESLLTAQSFKPELKVSNKYQFEMNSFDASTLPIFCKIEHKIESVSKIALRFRLGELNYVNMLENKQ